MLDTLSRQRPLRNRILCAWGIVLLASWLTGLGSANAAATVSVTESVRNGQKALILANAHVRLVVVPALGARVSSYRPAGGGADWIPSGDSGLLMDHVTQQKWPGELMKRRYDYRIEQAGPERAAVSLWTAIEGDGDETISGVRLTKRLRLGADSPLVEVDYRLENASGATKSPALWVQNILAPAGFADARYTFRPITLGVLECKWGAKSGRTARFEDSIAFRFDPTAGWAAQLHSPSRQGVVFLADYNWLKCLYCCLEAMTTEWWYERATLPPGKAFETTVRIWPVRELSSIAHASGRMVAELMLTRTGRTIQADNRLVAGPEGAEGLTVKLELVDYRGGEALAAKSLQLARLSAHPQHQSLQLEDVEESVDVVARVTVSADGWREQYERFSGGAAILGTETRYRVARPARKRPIHKPPQIVKARNPAPRILHLRGLFEHYYRWPEVCKVLGGQMKSSSYTLSVFGPSISFFPTSYDELMAYDVIVLSNLPADGLNEEHLEYLEDFALHGGLVLVIGGPTSFNTGGYRSSRIEKLLPVRVSGPFELARLEAPAPLATGKADAGVFEYYQKTAGLKDDAGVVNGTKARPIVSARRHGKGVVAMFHPLCLGRPKTGEGFWRAEGYPEWMAGVVRTLLGRTETYRP